MKPVAQFFKVTEACFTDKAQPLQREAGAIYQRIQLPRRATTGSAGYDFYMPYQVDIAPGKSLVIPTGIRAKIQPGYMLALFPRSGLGFTYRMQLQNTVGIVDSDYYFSDNEGHILAKVYNGSDRLLHLEAGKAFMQGVFIPYGITVDDDAEGMRTGGFGSTDS